MQHNNNIPRTSCSIPSVSRPYYLNLGQIQSGTPESASVQSVSSSRCGHSDPYLGQIQKNEILLDMMLRRVNRKKVTVPKVCRNGKSKANENRCSNFQCKKYECHRPTCSNGIEQQRDEPHNLENDQFIKQAAIGLRESRIKKNFRSKIPLYIRRSKAGQATNNNCPLRAEDKNKQTKESILPLPLTKNALNVRSKVPLCRKGCVAAKGTVGKRPSREDLEDFYDCQSNSRSSLNTSLRIDDFQATGSRSLTKEECETEQQTLKYSLESTILDLYEGNFKTKPAAKRDEVEACNFLLDLIKERINSISSIDKDPGIRTTRSCIHMRQFGTCEFKCDKPSLTCFAADNQNNAETREEDCNQCTEEEQCVEYEEELCKTASLIEDLSETNTMQYIAEDSPKTSDHCLDDICQCTQKPYVEHKEESSEMAKTESYVVETTGISEVKRNDINLEHERAPEAQHIQHIEEPIEIVEKEPKVLIETTSTTNTIVPPVTGTSRWRLDDNQRTRGAAFGLIGYKSLHKSLPKIEETKIEENPEYLFKERKKQKPFLIDYTQRAKGEGLGVLGKHPEIDDENEQNTENRENLKEHSTPEITERITLTSDNEQQSVQNIESDFKKTKLQNAFDMDRTQRSRAKEIGIIANKRQKTELILEDSDASLVLEQKNEEKMPDIVMSVENTDTSPVVEQNNEEKKPEKVINIEKLDDIEPQKQHSNGQSLCMFFMKENEIEKKKTIKASTSQNEVIPKEQNVIEEEVAQSSVTEDAKKNALQERNCNCSDCFPSKIPIELRNHRVNYTSCHNSNQEKFSCRIHQEQKENHNNQIENKITEGTLAQERLKSSRHELPAHTEKRDSEIISESSSQEYNNHSSSKNKLPSKSQIEDKNLAFFKCLAEQIRGKRKRSRAECNNQVHNQLPAIDQRNAKQFLYNSDHRSVQTCNRSTSPWISKDTNNQHITTNAPKQEYFTRALNEPKEQQINVKSSSYKSAICPCAAKEPINQQTITDATKNSGFAAAESTNVLNDQINKQNSCCNHTACLSITITDTARNIRFLNEPKEQLNMQSSCSNRSTCPWIAKDLNKHQTVAGNTRVLNEPEKQLNVQSPCSNRSSCPWIPKDSIKHQTLAATAENARVLSEPKGQLSAHSSCCNRSSCPWIMKDSIKQQTVAATAGNARVSNESKGQLSAQTSCCNRSSCPWIAKDSIKHQTVTDTLGNNKNLNKPKVQINTECSRSNLNPQSGPLIAKETTKVQTLAIPAESTKVLSEPKEQIKAKTPCCNGSSCPWFTKTSTAESTRALSEPTEQINARNSCCDRATCPRIARKSLYQHTITDIMENACLTEAESTTVLNDSNEQIACCNTLTCPWISKEPIKHNEVESSTVLNEAHCQELPIEKICSCKRKRCSFAENLSQEKNQLCAARKESMRSVIFEEHCDTAAATPTPQNTECEEQLVDCCCSENKSNCKLLDRASSDCTILNDIELTCAKDSAKETNFNLKPCTCAVLELEEPEEEIESSEADSQQCIAAKNTQQQCEMDPFLGPNEPNCNFYCSKMPVPACSGSIQSISSCTCKEMRRNSKTKCDIPPAHVPFFSEMYETHEEKQWNNPNASIQEEYFSCASCSSASSSGTSTSSKSSNDCVITNGNHITIIPGSQQKWNEKTQLKQEQERCCRCLKCLAATYYEGSMQNFQCSQHAYNNEKTRSFANTMCQTEKSTINPCQHKDAESYCCLDRERHAPKRRADFDVIVSAGHSDNPCFSAGKRRRVQKK